ncbi:hypothetical protein BDZ97DRAFT_103729 [Flammula alnicola]|nr:hypothetical protein BDZ97DRAFT_103729 [Flammula alnicola]
MQLLPETGDPFVPDIDLVARKCATLAGLVVILWDVLVSCRKEYYFIFRSPKTRVKWLYLFSRYYGLASQIAALIVVLGPLSNVPVKPRTCEGWFYFQMANNMSLLGVVEIILVLRVYALYQKNLIVGGILTFAVLLEIAANIYNSIHNIPQLDYNAACIIINTPTRKQVLRTAEIVLFTQCTMWGLALWKYKKCLPDGWADVPVVAQVMRDGGSFFVGICGLYISYPFCRTMNPKTG